VNNINRAMKSLEKSNGVADTASGGRKDNFGFLFYLALFQFL